VLGAAAQKHAAGTAIDGLLAAHEAKTLGIEIFSAFDVSDKQAYRADLGDLEGARQQDPIYIVFSSQVVAWAMPRVHLDFPVDGLGQLGGFRHLRQWGLLVEAAVIHVARLAQPVPADLLDAVVEFVGVTVRVVDIDMPIAARHVAPDPLNADLLLLEIGVRIDNLFEATALPGDLIDRDLGREFAVGTMVHDPFREQHEGVVVGPVAHEITARVAEIGILGEPREIERIGGGKAEQVAIELAAL